MEARRGRKNAATKRRKDARIILDLFYFLVVRDRVYWGAAAAAADSFL